MKTVFLKKRVKEIVQLLCFEADKLQDFKLTYCDKFTSKSCLDMVISVNLISCDNGGFNENYLCWWEFDSCSVDKFDCLDESGLELLSESQRKELVMYVNELVKTYYS